MKLTPWSALLFSSPNAAIPNGLKKLIPTLICPLSHSSRTRSPNNNNKPTRPLYPHRYPPPLRLPVRDHRSTPSAAAADSTSAAAGIPAADRRVLPAEARRGPVRRAPASRIVAAVGCRSIRRCRGGRRRGLRRSALAGGRREVGRLGLSGGMLRKVLGDVVGVRIDVRIGRPWLLPLRSCCEACLG